MHEEIERVRAALENVMDPEIPVVNLRELGILRAVRASNEGVEVVITPTYSGCPAMERMADDIRAALSAAGVMGRVTTQLAPAWTTEWITSEAKKKLRAYGIAPPNPRGNGVSAIHFFKPQDPSVKVICPNCGSADTTQISAFGSTACKALWKCNACSEPFDYFKPY